MNNGFILTNIEETYLTSEDKELLNHPAIFGVLLFSRNYESPDQLCCLVQSIHRINPDLIIAVDQEGGRVQRFSKGFTDLYSMQHWGRLFDTDPEDATKHLRQQTVTMVTELQECGVQASLAPVLDIDYGLSDIIGERSFHQNPEVIARLAKDVIDVMHHHQMPTVGKHFPGHGAVKLDSHLDHPVDDRPWKEIWQHDLLPYRRLIDELDAIMPSHISYRVIDSWPPCFSGHWIGDILRRDMNYQGIVMTDDLSMVGASCAGNYEDRARFALESGCDILTLCNNRSGLLEVISCLGNYLNPLSQERIRRYLRFIT